MTQTGGAKSTGGGGVPSTQTDSTAARTGSGGNTGGTGSADIVLTDAQIFGVLDTVNNGEIDHANLALEKATAAEVKAYAEQMITDHSQAKEQTRDLAEAQSISSADSQLSQTLQDKADQKAEELSALSGDEFDRAYMESQAKMHSETLVLIDETLLAQEDESDLKTFLEGLRDVVSEHQDMAEMILEEL